MFSTPGNAEVILPPSDATALQELAVFMDEHCHDAAHTSMSLSVANHEQELPAEVARALKLVVETLDSKMGVSIAVVAARLTTSEAAQVLGISRPTLVRLLDEGVIPYERPRKHRLVRLADVLTYQRNNRAHLTEARPADAATK
ncbi:MAG: helix-turn-helix domain-containing protein [Propionibacteriaceae bacterium]|jgi:excisionase family DNA binding protein|nr:helix-turn-helix domain-containing protein [Propionibacteriaceae bacterium]